MKTVWLARATQIDSLSYKICFEIRTRYSRGSRDLHELPIFAPLSFSEIVLVLFPLSPGPPSSLL